MLTSCGGSDTNTISVQPSKTYQTMEGFGASAAWWAQDVGGWTEKDASGEEVRTAILKLLYSDEGIDLDIYRYNLGAGAKVDDDSYYSDPWRKTQSFIGADGQIDYSLDANAVWCMQKAVELGVPNVVFFSNCAPNTMTLNGKTHGDPDTSRLNYVGDDGKNVYYTLPNLDPSQYANFANYVLDAVEHFRAQGIPVQVVSPINEPQWSWQGGQEGCHYEPDEVVALYRVFLKEMQNRGLDDLELSMFESGQAFGDPLTSYLEPIMNDSELNGAIRGLDTHSYWGNADQKRETALYLEENYPKLPVCCTEWTEMVNGKDVTMDSALTLANTMAEDITILNAVSWTYWIGVSAYDYRDGLIYVDRDAHTYETTKRLYALGNFSKFVDVGAVRVKAETGEECPLTAVAFDNGDSVAVVVINATEQAQDFSLRMRGRGKYSEIATYVTDAAHNLEKTEAKAYAKDETYSVSAQSVTTFVLTKQAN